jgi:hypothetical protein
MINIEEKIPVGPQCVKLQQVSDNYVSLTVCFITLIEHICQLQAIYVLTFDVPVTVHRRHSEGKEPTRCDKVAVCFGHQYAHHQEYN